LRNCVVAVRVVPGLTVGISCEDTAGQGASVASDGGHDRRVDVTSVCGLPSVSPAKTPRARARASRADEARRRGSMCTMLPARLFFTSGGASRVSGGAQLAWRAGLRARFPQRFVAGVVGPSGAAEVLGRRAVARSRVDAWTKRYRAGAPGLSDVSSRPAGQPTEGRADRLRRVPSPRVEPAALRGQARLERLMLDRSSPWQESCGALPVCGVTEVAEPARPNVRVRRRGPPGRTSAPGGDPLRRSGAEGALATVTRRGRARLRK